MCCWRETKKQIRQHKDGGCGNDGYGSSSSSSSTTQSLMKTWIRLVRAQSRLQCGQMKKCFHRGWAQKVFFSLLLFELFVVAIIFVVLVSFPFRCCLLFVAVNSLVRETRNYERKKDAIFLVPCVSIPAKFRRQHNIRRTILSWGRTLKLRIIAITKCIFGHSFRSVSEFRTSTKRKIVCE